MNDKFRNKYRIQSSRLKTWSYLNDGYYFVTILTKNRELFFGNIKNKQVFLNELGNIAQKYWLEIPQHFPNTILDKFIVMPNHIHGIIMINKQSRDLPWQVSTNHLNIELNNFAKPIKNSLSVIINHFKGAVSRYCNKNEISFSWQSRFYDIVIKNKISLREIREYIINNPSKWKLNE